MTARPDGVVGRGPHGRLGVLSRGLSRITTLHALLDNYSLVGAASWSGQKVDGIVVWGRKRSALKAHAFARRHDLKVISVEDGLLRSVRPAPDDQPLSIVVDELGVYYDATTPSILEAQVATSHDEAQRARARRLVSLWCDGRLSKYNHARELQLPISGNFVLAVDQTAGDASIRYGMANRWSFARMIEAALDEHPGFQVLLKVHPEVVSGRKCGHFEALTPGQAARVTVLATDAHPPAVLDAAHAVYTVTSQMGFEALMHGKPVRTFGMPFYAGWGLTRDELPAPDRRRTGHEITLEDLVHAALVEYPRYLDPETGRRCEPERLMEWMALQRRMRERFPARLHAVGFSRWKKPIVRAFLAGSTVHFARTADGLPADGACIVWGAKTAAPAPAPVGAPVAVAPIRLEDGFLRSVGLGADLVRPLSWVADDLGIYYDATRPSRLETLLRETRFDTPLLERARALRERIVAAGLTKYNVGAGIWQHPPRAKRLVLVPGQVEDDASIAWGAAGLRSNLALLRAVREADPDAWLVYKPHPDVVAGLRRCGDGESQAGRWCDEIVTDAPIHELLDAADRVHVLTSLAGFEALLRGKGVTTWGCPFYAGWGLTDDRAHAPEVWSRRGRSLSIDELVAAALILYPAYVSRHTNAFTTPERALDELLAWRSEGASAPPAWRRAMRPVLGWLSRMRRT